MKIVLGVMLAGLMAIALVWLASQVIDTLQSTTNPPVLRITAPVFRAFADGGKSISELKEKLTSYRAQADAITALADEEHREMTAEEATQVTALCDSFDACEAEIKRRERVANLGSRLEQPSPRKTSAEVPASAVADRAAPITGGEPTAAKKGTMGFKAMAEFSRAVVSASLGRGRLDPRLTQPQDAAAGTYGNESTGADGGYLVPPDFRTEIMTKVLDDQDDLFSRCDSTTTQSNAVSMVTDETSPWQTTGGVQAYWEGEAQAMPQSKAALGSVLVRAYKLTALVPVTDEQLEDGPSLETHIRRKAPVKIAYKLNDAIMNGDGTGKPLGIMQSPALITQAAEGGQTAGTVNFNNITKMYARMLARCRRNAVWVTNQDLEPQLAALVIPGSNASFPAYLPAGAGLRDNPYATLMGRPVLYSEATAAVGAVGDIVLVDFMQYLTVLKSSGLKTDVSMHLWFDQNLTALRFTFRAGGAPWWKTTIARPGAKQTVSAFIALAAR